MQAPPARAPAVNVTQADRVVARPPVCPTGPIVSIIENPHGDQVPQTPGEQRGHDQHQVEPAQHGTLVWKYMTQKTLRPR